MLDSITRCNRKISVDRQSSDVQLVAVMAEKVFNSLVGRGAYGR
jgi:hypothetical protein